MTCSSGEPEEEAFAIARKPDHKLEAMLQDVDDTKHIAKRLTEVGWPLRWQAWTAERRRCPGLWSTNDQGHTYDTQGMAGQDVWLRYRHIMPTEDDWKLIESGRQPPMVADRPSELITDFYAYNAFTTVDRNSMAKYRAGEAARGIRRRVLWWWTRDSVGILTARTGCTG